MAELDGFEGLIRSKGGGSMPMYPGGVELDVDYSHLPEFSKELLGPVGQVFSWDGKAAGPPFLEPPSGVRDQGDAVSCCVSMALVTCMEILDAQSGRYTKLSPLYNYYLARQGGSIESKMRLDDALYSARDDGVAPEDEHPTPDPVTRRAAEAGPNDSAVAAAPGYKLYYKKRWRDDEAEYGYCRLPCRRTGHAEAWKQCLLRGKPILAGIFLADDYDTLEQDPARTYLPSFSVDRRRGHAVTVVGMDESRKAFRVLDSKGEGFCGDGHWWLPYDALGRLAVGAALAILRLSY